MKPWRYWVDDAALREMLPLRRGDWWTLLVIFDRIRERPFAGDDSIEDIHGRWTFLRVLGPFVVTYYEDHPVRHLMITDVKKVRLRR